VGWEDFDSFDVEEGSLARLFNEVVLPILEISEERFKQIELEIDSEFDKAIDEASNEADEIDAKGWAAYKASVLDDQVSVVSAALLNVLCSGVKHGLEAMGGYFGTSRPAREKYEGKSWLHRKQAEFKDRFGIDFETHSQELGAIEEMILARNAGIHQDDATLKEYREKVSKPRFLNEFMCLSFKRAAFVGSFEDANRFLKWVWTGLKQIRNELGLKEPFRLRA
jgi:hypothetical protein